MKIRSVEANNRRKSFTLKTDRGEMEFPYASAPLPPTAGDRVVDVFPDPATSHEAFTYRLESGSEDTIHVDVVLTFNRDPETMKDLLLFRLTAAAQDALSQSGISKRALLRRLGTSASQLYRLLDTTNYSKSVDQMLRLLTVLGKEVELVVR